MMTEAKDIPPPFDIEKFHIATADLMRERPSLKDEWVDRIVHALLLHDSVVVSVGGRDVYRIVKLHLADGRSILDFEPMGA